MGTTVSGPEPASQPKDNAIKSAKLLELAVNHVILPPKLPGHQDSSPIDVEIFIFNHLIAACEELVNSLPKISAAREELHAITCLIETLKLSRSVHGEYLDKDRVSSVLHQVDNICYGLVLFVREQNAALYIHRDTSLPNDNGRIIFEAFEASTPSQAALSADALERHFPDTAASMSKQAFLNPEFQSALSDFLDQASSEQFELFASKIKKGHTFVVEKREPSDPTLITQTLMPLIETLGRHEAVVSLRKAIRDDVVWDDAEIPWRRSPFWLSLRVAAHRLLSQILDGPRGRAVYKFITAIVIVRLLDSSRGQLSPDLGMLIMKKLSRRMAKLETDRQRDDGGYRPIYNIFFEATKPRLLQSIANVRGSLEKLWKYDREKRLRQVPRLPTVATDADMRLSLPNSRQYLKFVLSAAKNMNMAQQPPTVVPSDMDTKHHSHLVQKLESLFKKETSNILPKNMVMLTQTTEDVISSGFVALYPYICAAKEQYHGRPDLMSICILSVLDCWMMMDCAAVNICPILARFNPVFKPATLDFLQLDSIAHMTRLRKIQEYLQKRWDNCGAGAGSIFDDPKTGCFAQLYIQEDTKAADLKLLWDRISTASREARERKESEFSKMNEKYREHTQEIQGNVCVCSVNRDGTRNVNGCVRCYHWRCRKRMKINVHEDYLPSPATVNSKNWHAAAIVLELGLPKWLSNYRETTWLVIEQLACPEKPSKWEPVLKLNDFSLLKKFRGTNTDGIISLSSDKKAFTQSHYAGLPFPTGIKSVCVPFGPDFKYHAGQYSPAVLANSPSFIHHCGLVIPKSMGIPPLSLDGLEWPTEETPSSSQIVARQPMCPAHMSVHEYTALMSLVSSTQRRWPTILRELGASNINFSSEDTTILLTQLVTQIGPSNNNNISRGVRGDLGWAFGDSAFCHRLYEQIDRRLDAIAGSWREFRYMDTLITLALRLVGLGLNKLQPTNISLILKAQKITMEWVSHLRKEIFDCQEAATTLKLAEFAMSAAILCRRTFSIYNVKDFMTGDAFKELDAENLCVYIQASIAIQQHFLTPMADLPDFQRRMLMHDTLLACKLRNKVLAAIDQHPSAFESGIASGWADTAKGQRQYSSWQHLSGHSGWNKHWMEAHTIATHGTRSQDVHYNLVDGRLLVDGKPLGQLPIEFTKSETVKRLFQSRHLRVMPSPIIGMSYQLHVLMDNNWQIHFGFRNKEVFVWAKDWKSTCEYIPESQFKGANGTLPDLPYILINNCAHWLDLRSYKLECRRQPHIWRNRPSDWVINVEQKRANRKHGMLIDPFSPMFRLISSIFDGFVDTAHLTVFQIHNKVRIEIKHLTLSFYVNPRGQLYCQELNSLVDINQDVGTFYGMKSMIVLRDYSNQSQRSLIVPLGNAKWRLEGISTSIYVENDGSYGHFTIDPVIGRLNCAPEPRLLYTKALYHAYTSSILPDPLTGRTGVEESLHFLQSPICQPWRTLFAGNIPVLEKIAQLSPRRNFYPETLEIMERVEWSKSLPWWVQHDSFRPAAQRIIDKGNELARLSRTDGHENFAEAASLRQRAQLRRSRFEVDGFSTLPLSHKTSRKLYTSRFFHQIASRQNVRWALNTLNSNPFLVKPEKQLRSHLEQWKWMCPVSSDERVSATISSLLQAELHDQWWTYVTLASSMSRIHASFFLSVLSHKLEEDIMMILAAFCRIDERRNIAMALPDIELLVPFVSKDKPAQDVLEQLALNYAFEIGDSEFSRERHHKLAWADKAVYEGLCAKDSKALVKEILKHWPCPRAPIPDGFKSNTIRVFDAIDAMQSEWGRAYQNHLLDSYVGMIDIRLGAYRGIPPPALLPAEGHTSFFSPPRDPSHDMLTVSLLAKKPGRTATVTNTIKIPTGLMGVARAAVGQTTDRQLAISKLELILGSMKGSKSELRQRYALDLQESLNDLRQEVVQYQVPRMLAPAESMRNVEDCWYQRHEILGNLQKTLLHGDPRSVWLNPGGLWPTMSPISLLEQLRSISNVQFGPGMKDAFIQLGTSLTELQRARRINDASVRQNFARFQEEHRNRGHSNWHPREYPDWLLLEIDSNILIRPDQVDVARATMNPETGKNSVLQMNMGRGKTSCIMPMAVAALADGKQLCRLVVPKALLVQTAQTIQAKISYLVGRELSHVPFSRQTKPTLDDLEVYRSFHSRTLDSRGVMLTLPEHILSYKLSGIQALSDKKDTAKDMIKHQDWLTSTCRDILDESDFTLAVKTQLIYPSGSEVAVDGHPHRWLTVQILLGLVESHVRPFSKRFPQSIQIVERDGSFPLIFFLRSDVEDALMERVVDDVVGGKASIFRSLVIGKPVNSAALKKIVYDRSITLQHCQKVCASLHGPAVALKQILLIRGLVQQRVLVMCLKKRWNVQYGLHPNRIPIAVPYEAKGIPSEQAEFGHPDVAIILTCLSFYYSGVTLAQLQCSLQRILNSDDPATEYDQWISGSQSLREELRHWNLINADDEGQVRELWARLHMTKNVLDHFLNVFVFPRHAKQFSVKLQASGWDIPLFKTKNHQTIGGGLTTGFSGTNDNRYLLPLTIQQQDLSALKQTNAEVLAYLLESRNSRYVVSEENNGARMGETGLLNLLNREKTRVLIDAGASILEMDNRKLVQAWLDIDHEAEAAIYFDADKPMVKYKQGRDMPLIATPYAENLEKCLVYLDEVHTRGTDLKLPAMAKGAVTLGLGQTKDHTVQAAMRLRQLGTTQSIMFVAPPEVDLSIRTFGSKRPTDVITSVDVIKWLLEQTCKQNEQMRPLYHSQGMDFCCRSNAVHRFPNRLGSVTEAQAYIGTVFTPEHQTIEDLYCADPSIAHSSKSQAVDFQSAILTNFAHELKQLRGESQAEDFAQMYSAALEEVEQEREVEFQVEEIRENQKPPTYKPLKFAGLHPNIRRFALEGVLDIGNTEGSMELFDVIRRTHIGQKFGITKGQSLVAVSAQWSRTVATKSDFNEGMMRPVEWILVNPTASKALVIISEEAEEVLALLRLNKDRALTHLVVYSAPVTKHMSLFNKMQYYSYPPISKLYKPPVELMADLGLLAGRLYFAFSEYEFLLSHFANTASMGKNSLEFLSEWLVMCRKGQDIMHTPIGYICQGRPLAESHPFFIDGHASGSSGSPDLPSGTGFGGLVGAYAGHDDGDDDGDDTDDEQWVGIQEKISEVDAIIENDDMLGRNRTGSESTVYDDGSSGSSVATY